MPFRKNGRGWARRPNRKRQRRSAPKRKKQTFCKRVMKCVESNVETKYMAPLVQRDNQIYTKLQDNVTQCIPLMPILAQGSGQGDRVGNMVSTKKVMLYLNANIYQITTTSNSDPPKYVDFYIYKYKKSNSQTSVDLRKFLQYGNISTDYDGAGLPESGGLNVNNDVFTLKKHFRRQMWNPNQNNTYAMATRNVMNANSYKFDITSFYKKKLVYDDEVTNVVTNDNLFISVVFTNNDNQPYADTTAVGNFDATVMYHYTDL